MLTWPEVWKGGRAQQLATPGTRNLLENFRDYIAPDGQVFQFASGLGSHYTSTFWLAAMERAATIFNDGSFRFAARLIWESLGRQNVTSTDQNMASCAKLPPANNLSCCHGCFPKGGIPDRLHEHEGHPVLPSPATHASLTVLKAGETVYETL